MANIFASLAELTSAEVTQKMQPIIFTRYLYSKLEVKQSMLISLLDHNCDEALFWAYELYYSGFQAEVFDYLRNLHDWLYYEDNPRINIYIQALCDDWVENSTRDWHLGSIVATLCGRHYQLSEFMHTYFNVKTKPVVASKPNSALLVRFSKKDITAYQTIECDNPRFYLRDACRYAVHKEVNQLFKTEPKSLQNEYYNHWEYYAYRSTYWSEIIDKYNGIVNHEKKTIDFLNENDMEAFYDIWAIEPDEQPLSVQSKSIGTGDEHLLSLSEFCKKYGAALHLQQIKIARTLIF